MGACSDFNPNLLPPIAQTLEKGPERDFGQASGMVLRSQLACCYNLLPGRPGEIKMRRGYIYDATWIGQLRLAIIDMIFIYPVGRIKGLSHSFFSFLFDENIEFYSFLQVACQKLPFLSLG
ncbi:hypothetical protein K1719_024883 [Acacia pycnantha]|nr:hypothetical protein K1719_024883 [Acacia pycnantha]